MRIRPIIRLLVLTTALAFALSATAACAAAKLKVGDKAPSFTLKDIKGNTYKLSSYQGKRVVVLDFGRFTCEPCRNTMKNLQKLHTKYKSKGLQVFAVNLDGPLAPRVVPQGIKDLGITFPVLLDNRTRTALRYGVQIIPHVVLVDTHGIVRFTHERYDPDIERKLSALIDKYRPKGR